MARGYKNLRTATSTRENTEMGNQKAMANTFGQMDLITKATFSMD